MNPTINVNWVPGITLEEMEKQCILAAFRFYRGNKTTTAQVLGIAIRTLDNKLEKYESDRKRDEDRFATDAVTNEQTLRRMRGITITEHNAIGSAHQLRQPEVEKAGTQQREATGTEANAGIREQSPEKLSAQQSVPVSKRQEVQSVLPGQASGSGNRRGR